MVRARPFPETFRKLICYTRVRVEMASSTSDSSEQNLHLVMPDGWIVNESSIKENEPPPKKKYLSLRKKQESSGSNESATRTFLTLELILSRGAKYEMKPSLWTARVCIASFGSKRKHHLSRANFNAVTVCHLYAYATPSIFIF